MYSMTINTSFTTGLGIFLLIIRRPSAIMYLQTFTIFSALMISARLLKTIFANVRKFQTDSRKTSDNFGLVFGKFRKRRQQMQTNSLIWNVARLVPLHTEICQISLLVTYTLPPCFLFIFFVKARPQQLESI